MVIVSVFGALNLPTALMTLTKEIAGHTCGVSLSVDEVDRWALWVDIHGDGNNIELETFDTKEEVSE